jgi:hypothetical protein
VADGAEQRLLEVLAPQDDDSAGFHEEGCGAAGFFLSDGQEGGAAHGHEFDAAAAVAVVALADLLEVLCTRIGPAAPRLVDAFGPGDVAVVDDAVASAVGGDLLATGDAGVTVVASSCLRPGNRTRLLFVVLGEMACQCPPDLSGQCAVGLVGEALELGSRGRRNLGTHDHVVHRCRCSIYGQRVYTSGAYAWRVTRREAIGILLAHYQDVMFGLRDSRSGGDGVPIMCSVARHPSYLRLAELLPLLRQAEPRAWRAVVATFVYPSFRRRAWCPRCGAVAPPDRIGQVHKHGQKAVALQARMIRTPLYPVEQAHVENALRWLNEQWGGAVYVPDELRNVAAVA